MPPIPCGIAGAAGSLLGLSAIMHSVVVISEDTPAAFTSAVRTTFVGSTTPALNMFVYVSFSAL